jgi:ABC-type amino acid transport substrate-binding protein
LLIRNRLISCAVLLPLLAICGCKPGGENGSLDAMAAMKKNKQVRIGTDPVNLPFEYGLDTGVQGFDVDIGNEIAKDLGYDARWIKLTGYNRLLESLKNGEIEMVISTIAVDPDKEKDFAFSQPYFDSGDGIARRKDEPNIKELADLSGKTVGVVEGRPGDKFMATQKTAANVTIKKFQNLDEALGALNLSEINAVVGDEPVMVVSGWKTFHYVITIPTEVNKYRYAVVVRKNDKALLESVNKTLKRMQDAGEIAALQEKWFQDIPQKAAEELKRLDEQERLKHSPKRINVVINATRDYPIDRLEGYQMDLVGSSGSFRSDYITTSGTHGRCSFNTPVPPGDYVLKVSRIGLAQEVKIPELPQSTLSLTMDQPAGGGMKITIK